MLTINNKGNVYHVLSVGITGELVPTVTILENGNPSVALALTIRRLSAIG